MKLHPRGLLVRLDGLAVALPLRLPHPEDLGRPVHPPAQRLHLQLLLDVGRGGDGRLHGSRLTDVLGRLANTLRSALGFVADVTSELGCFLEGLVLG